MSKKPLAEQFKRNTAVSLIICLFVLLWLPTLDYFFYLDRAPASNENRALARFPTISATLAGIHDFPVGLEAYFRDHFGFRNRLIRWERRWKHDLFRESGSPDVIAGKDGWYFFSGDHMIEQFQGLSRLSEKDLQSWQALLEKRRDWLAQRGIKYLFVVPPDKHSIYPELLPDWLAHLGGTTRLDQFVAHMKAHSTVEILDLRPALIEAKKLGWIYLQLDTHWNSVGGFAAYQAVMNALSRQLPELSAPLPLTAFNRNPSPQTGGDLTTLLGLAHPPAEPNAIKLSPVTPATKLAITNATYRFPKKWRPLTDPMVTSSDEAAGKAIVFRDSFAGAWYGFLGHHFHEVLYIWQYEWDAAFIEREKPTVVVDEILERFFNVTDPKKLMDKDALP